MENASAPIVHPPPTQWGAEAAKLLFVSALLLSMCEDKKNSKLTKKIRKRSFFIPISRLVNLYLNVKQISLTRSKELS